MSGPPPISPAPGTLFQDFPELEGLSRDDLQELLSNPAYLSAFFNSLPRVQAMRKHEELQMLANQDLAKRNMALGERLVTLRQETARVYEDARAAKARWAQLEKEHKEVSQRYTPQFLLLRLRHATTAQDDLSESLASAFIAAQPSPLPSAPGTPPPDLDSAAAANGAGHQTVEDFVREFREVRKVYHKRAIWTEKWGRGEVHWED